MEFGHEVCDRDIDEVSCGNQKRVGQKRPQEISERKGKKHSEDCRKRYEEIIQKRFFLIESPVDKNAEIAYLLRYFVKYDCGGREKSEPDVGKKRKADDNPVDGVMQKVPPKNQMGVTVDFSIFAVMVVPDEEFFENEKQKDPAEYKNGKRFKRFAACCKGFGDEFKKRNAQKRANRKAHGEVCEPLHLFFAEYYERCAGKRDDAFCKRRSEREK